MSEAVAEAFRRVLVAGFPVEMVLEAHRQVKGMGDGDLAIAETASRALSEQAAMERRRRRRLG